MASTTDVAEMLQTFITSEGHDLGWNKLTYAVVQYTSNGETRHFVAKNLPRRHTEDDIIEHLKCQLKEGKVDSPNVKIYISFSPCHECSQKLIALLDHTKSEHGMELNVEIVFSDLYRIKRPSCKKDWSCNGHLSQFTQADHDNNVAQLKNLQRKGVQLRTFKDQDWLDLRRGLDSLRKEGELLKKDFEIILKMPRSRDQIQPSQLFIDMSPQTSQADQSKEKVNVPSMSMNHVTPGCNSSEDEKDRIPACKRKREDAGSNEEQEKKVKKQKEEKAKRGLKGTTSKRRGRGGKISQRGGTTSKKGSNSSGSRSNTAKGKGNTPGRGGNILRRGGNTLRTRGNTAGRGGFVSKRGGNTSGRRGNISGRGRNTPGRRGGNTSGRRGGNTSGRRGGNTLGKRGGNTSGKRGGNISGRRGGNTSGRRGNVSRRRTTTGRGGHTS